MSCLIFLPSILEASSGFGEFLRREVISEDRESSLFELGNQNSEIPTQRLEL